jgi:hypothetical protein
VQASQQDGDNRRNKHSNIESSHDDAEECNVIDDVKCQFDD